MIYLDNAATTQMKKEVLDAMMPYFISEFGNPSANYDFAKKIKKDLDIARTQIAELINCKPEEIYFTSGGTESDNWAIKAVAEKYSNKGKHIITTKIEHHAVLHTTQWLEKNGFEITYLDVNQDGFVDPKDVEQAIRDDTILISIMFANNEIGSIQPIKEIGSIARKNKIVFHTDAVQAFGHVLIDVKKMKIDLLSASGHKINGPKGIGILYIKSGTNINAYMHGGAQEHGRRGGTYNVPAIIGMGMAASIASENLKKSNLENVRNYFIERLLKEIPFSHINGDRIRRLPNNINIRFEYVDAEALLVMLNEYGICASIGSACTTGQIEPSHVLTAIGLSSDEANSSVRLTISDEITDEDIDFVVEKMKASIERLRGGSVMYKKAIQNRLENN